MHIYQIKHTIGRDDLKAGENRSTVEEKPVNEEGECSLLAPLIDLLDEMRDPNEALPSGHDLMYHFFRDCLGMDLHDIGSEESEKCTDYEEEWW